MRVKLEDTVALTKEIVHAYYQGNPEPWFRRLCSKSVWATTGERIIAGGEAIREHYAPVSPGRASVFSRRSTSRSPLTPGLPPWWYRPRWGGRGARRPISP